MERAIRLAWNYNQSGPWSVIEARHSGSTISYLSAVVPRPRRRRRISGQRSVVCHEPSILNSVKERCSHGALRAQLSTLSHQLPATCHAVSSFAVLLRRMEALCEGGSTRSSLRDLLNHFLKLSVEHVHLSAYRIVTERNGGRGQSLAAAARSG